MPDSDDRSLLNRFLQEQAYFKAIKDRQKTKPKESIQIGDRVPETGRYQAIHADGITSNGIKTFNAQADGQFVRATNSGGQALALDHRNARAIKRLPSATPEETTCAIELLGKYATYATGFVTPLGNTGQSIGYRLTRSNTDASVFTFAISGDADPSINFVTINGETGLTVNYTYPTLEITFDDDALEHTIEIPQPGDDNIVTGFRVNWATERSVTLTSDSDETSATGYFPIVVPWVDCYVTVDDPPYTNPFGNIDAFNRIDYTDFVATPVGTTRPSSSYSDTETADYPPAPPPRALYVQIGSNGNYDSETEVFGIGLGDPDYFELYEVNAIATMTFRLWFPRLFTSVQIQYEFTDSSSNGVLGAVLTPTLDANGWYYVEEVFNDTFTSSFNSILRRIRGVLVND